MGVLVTKVNSSIRQCTLEQQQTLALARVGVAAFTLAVSLCHLLRQKSGRKHDRVWLKEMSTGNSMMWIVTGRKQAQ